MAKKERDIVPNAVVITTHSDERQVIVDEWNDREPEFVHTWVSGQRDAYHLNRHNMEPVKVDGKVVPFMGDMLVRIPKAHFDKVQSAGPAKSLQRVERTLYATENSAPELDRRSILTRKASPRKPPRDEELNELGT